MTRTGRLAWAFRSSRRAPNWPNGGGSADRPHGHRQPVRRADRLAVGAKVPDAIADKLNADIRKVVNTPEFRKGLEEQGMSAVANTVPEAQAFVAREKQRWDRVITEGKITTN